MCPICIEPSKPVLSPCRYVHVPGLLERSHVKNECPMCRHHFPTTDAETVDALQPNADRGAAWAQYELGCSHRDGLGIDQSFKEAVELFTKAVEQGDAKAQNTLGLFYRKGEGVDKSFEQEAKWITKAAEQGDVEAQYNLGCYYAKGEGVAQ